MSLYDIDDVVSELQEIKMQLELDSDGIAATDLLNELNQINRNLAEVIILLESIEQKLG